MCYNKVMDIWTRLGRYASFETERMYLRPFTYKDSQDFFEICSNPDNLRFIFPSCATREESDFVMVYYFMKEPLGVWAIEDKKTHKMIGCIRFEKLDPSRMTAEIGYFMNQAFWGEGLMTECLKTLAFLNFQELGLQNLHVIAHAENIASQRVAQKSGFRLKCQFKGSDRYSRKMRDYVDYQLSKGDYHYE